MLSIGAHSRHCPRCCCHRSCVLICQVRQRAFMFFRCMRRWALRPNAFVACNRLKNARRRPSRGPIPTIRPLQRCSGGGRRCCQNSLSGLHSRRCCYPRGRCSRGCCCRRRWRRPALGGLPIPFLGFSRDRSMHCENETVVTRWDKLIAETCKLL